MSIKGLLFDKDGTLLDYYGTWMGVNRALAVRLAGEDEAAIEALMVRGGLEPGTGRIRAGTPLAAGTARQIAECLAPDLRGAEFETLVEDYQRIFTEGARKAAVAVEGLKETLEALAAGGYRLGIATTDSEQGVQASLGSFEVLRLFDFISGCDSGHGVKPDPGIVLAFCAAVGLEPAQVGVIGDNGHDLTMGRAAGAGLLIGVLTGTGEVGDLAPHAHQVIPSIATLPPLLEAAA